jgi:hypothetical protein
LTEEDRILSCTKFFLIKGLEHLCENERIN